MPFRPSPYGSPANPVIPIEHQFENLALTGSAPHLSPNGANSPQSQAVIPSGQSDHNSDEWILGPWPDSRRTSVANYSARSNAPSLPADSYQPSYPGMPQVQQESRPAAHRRAASNQQGGQPPYPYLGGPQNPFNTPFGQAPPGTGWMGPQPLPGQGGGAPMNTPRMAGGYIPSYPEASPYAGPVPMSPYAGGGQPQGRGHPGGGMPPGMPAGLGYGGMPGPMPGAMPGGWGALGGGAGAGAMVGYGMAAPVIKMGRPKEEEAGALFNRWDASPEYGVVLDPLQFTVLKAKVAVNPLLMPTTDDDPKKKSIIWNVLFDTNQAHLSTDRSSRSWNEGRDDPATFPRLTSVRLCSPCFPWIIDVSNQHGVTCGDVLDKLFDFFNRIIDKTEWESFPDTFKASVGAAYKWNRSTARGAPGGRYYGPAIKRGDILRTYTVWKGLVCDEKYVADQMGTPPGCTLVVVLESREPPPVAIGAPPT